MFLKCMIYIFALIVFSGQAVAENFNAPVDIVYLWVDGNDLEWQSIKAEYNSKHNQDMKPDAIAINRYSDHNELKYSLRSVWNYASFFNHIYIVTMDQKPEWFIDHPKISFISHRDIFLDQENLPTFNSMAIESNLHRIPNLSEHFIYFNDDMFLGNYVTASDFFTETGQVKVLFEKGKLSPEGSVKQTDITFWAACRNTNNFLNNVFKHELRWLICHAPYALLKSSMQETAMEFADVFASNSTHRFRCYEDYTITNGLLQYHWDYLGKVRKGNLTNKMVYFFDDENIKKTVKQLKKLDHYHPQTFCLQDKMLGEGLKTQRILNKFLEKWYPKRAPWEKPLQNLQME